MQFKTSVLGAAFVLGIALPSLAQNGTMTPLNDTPTPLGNTSTMAPSMIAPSAQDQLFVVRAAEGNLAEITLAQMALQRSKTPSVKNVAQTIITGHTQAQTELMAIAARKGMTLRPLLSVTHMAVSESLRKAKGANFDRMYMANQTDDHENTIALFQTQIDAGQDADLKTYAQKYLPDIVGHTIMIYTVARQVGAPGSEMRPPMPPVPPGVTPTMMPMDPSMSPMNGMMSSTQRMPSTNGMPSSQ